MRDLKIVMNGEHEPMIVRKLKGLSLVQLANNQIGTIHTSVKTYGINDTLLPTNDIISIIPLPNPSHTLPTIANNIDK